MLASWNRAGGCIYVIPEFEFTSFVWADVRDSVLFVFFVGISSFVIGGYADRSFRFCNGMAPLRFVGVAIAAVAVFAAGVSASEENPGQQPVIPKFDSVEFAKAAFGSGGDVSSSFPIGSSVRFEVLGQEYEVSRHEDTPEFLTIR